MGSGPSVGPGQEKGLPSRGDGGAVGRRGRRGQGGASGGVENCGRQEGRAWSRTELGGVHRATVGGGAQRPGESFPPSLPFGSGVKSRFLALPVCRFGGRARLPPEWSGGPPCSAPPWAGLWSWCSFLDVRWDSLGLAGGAVWAWGGGGGWWCPGTWFSLWVEGWLGYESVFDALGQGRAVCAQTAPRLWAARAGECGPCPPTPPGTGPGPGPFLWSLPWEVVCVPGEPGQRRVGFIGSSAFSGSSARTSLLAGLIPAAALPCSGLSGELRGSPRDGASCRTPNSSP